VKRFAYVMVALVAFAAGAPGAASGAPREVPEWQVARAEAVAAKAWGNPCGGAVTFRVKPIPAEDEAWAYDCTVEYNTTEYVPTDWPTFCSTMVHEYGHLAGFRDPRNTEDPAHSINPYSVMYATEPPVTADLPGEWYRHKKVHVVVGYEPRCAYHGRAFLGLPTTGMTRELWAWKPTRVIARIARAEGEGWMLRLPR
jgi:hypothetical protein